MTPLCGSGQKYEHCCLREQSASVADPQEQTWARVRQATEATRPRTFPVAHRRPRVTGAVERPSEPPALEVGKSLVQLLGRVHDERAVAGEGLAHRSSRTDGR